MKIPVYDFLVSNEREQQLIQEHPLKDPEKLLDAAEAQKQPLDIPIVRSRLDGYTPAV